MKTHAEMWKEQDKPMTEEERCKALNACFFMMGIRLPLGEGFIPGRDKMTKEERRAADRKRYENDHKNGIAYAKHDIKQGNWKELFYNKRFYHIDKIEYTDIIEVGHKLYFSFLLTFENGYEMTLLVIPGKAHTAKNVHHIGTDYEDRCVMELQSA